MKVHLRIDNRRQSVIRATLHYSLAMRCIASYHIPNDSLYFCLSNHVNEDMVYFIFRKLLILNRFSYFYFLNMNISLDICFPMMTFFVVGHTILLEGSVSQIFDLGLSFISMLKNG